MSGEQKPLNKLAAIGALLFLAGVVAWAWTGWWQWAVTGLCVLLALAEAGVLLDRRRQS